MTALILPALPWPDADINRVVVHWVSGDLYDLRVHHEKTPREHWTLERYSGRAEAMEVADALRYRIRAVRRLVGRNAFGLERS